MIKIQVSIISFIKFPASHVDVPKAEINMDELWVSISKIYHIDEKSIELTFTSNQALKGFPS